MTFFALTADVAWGLFSASVLLRLVHVLQAERYHTDAYLDWVLKGGGLRLYFRRPGDEAVHLVAFGFVSLLAGSYVQNFLVEAGLTALALFFSGRYLRLNPNHKKPLVITPRIKRLFAITAGIELCMVLPLWRFHESYMVCGMVLMGYLQPFMLALGNVLASPIEKRLQEEFKNGARAKLTGKRVVAITGSYGKTGTKEAVAHLLESKFPLLKTPGSFNTPMGLCLVINQKLAPHHEMFVTEMGATRPGDIRELCGLARPDIGIITSIGEAHLETFGSVENVAKTKFELADALPPDGLLVYNADYPFARSMAEGRPQKKISYALEHPADYMPVNLRCSQHGTTFDINTPRGTVEGVRIQLLGRLHALNVTAAFALGIHLGIEPQRLKNAAATLPQVPSRLELIVSDPGSERVQVTSSLVDKREDTGPNLIINDGFNSNPVGAAEALATLALFDGYKKVLVTPGIVDMGGKHEEANAAFGKNAARVCDAVLLVNERRTKPIADGLAAAGFNRENLRVFATLAEARVWLDHNLDKRSVILFENDLPDHMEEF